ncbi:MAG TPA: glucosidase [Burkholderiales bacterium]|nr:glucosidase [Burkholderiales bacterium]
MTDSGTASAARSAEHLRLAQAPAGRPGEWKAIGPYLSERAWGTVREDYSADGKAWEYFPHDHARSRAYRWSEDGLAGVCDIEQRMCLAAAFWNGRDPCLKERIFGLSGNEGNHGEDAKEYWWYVDATPTAAWLRWRYHYTQAEFPYARLREENAKRSKAQREFELVDTGIFDGNRYWRITADYAKAAPRDLCLRIRIRNAGPEPAELHVLPTLWFRNRWSWEEGTPKPTIRAASSTATGQASAIAEEASLGRWRLAAGPDRAGRAPALLFCENETNVARLYGIPARTPFPKDGINDHVVSGAATVNPAQRGTKLALWYRVAVAPGDTVELRLRLVRDDSDAALDLGTGFEQTLAVREREADAYYQALRPASASDDEAAVMRQAFAGMVWSQQFYHYDVERWLDGDPADPPPAARKSGRNAGWRHLSCHDVIAMPDKWEYPWYAAWDLAFHCVVLAHIDPAAAKHQLLLLCREWYMHPNGQLPAYEWRFGDVNPPVHAWAALAVFRIDGARDFGFLASAFHKLLINFTWWVNRKDALGDNIFEGGFLGLDNIGPIDRSAMLPGGELLEQSDGTAWMAKYCLNMLEMALRLANQDRSYEDVALKFFEHFASIATAMNELWDEREGFFYDRLRHPDGSIVPVRARSMVGLLPLFAAVELSASLWERLSDFRARANWFIANKPQRSAFLRYFVKDDRPELIALVDEARLRRVLACMLDENEFLSPYGLRSLSRYHREHPLVVALPGGEARLDYEPAESTTGLFGGNSNWRGPIWFPLNFLALESLRHLNASLGDGFTVELPTGSGRQANLGEVADEIERRLLRLFLLDDKGRRPVFGDTALFQSDPAWRDHILFYEYFHGDTGEGLGASHQTGWTALAGALVASRRAVVGR